MDRKNTITPFCKDPQKVTPHFGKRVWGLGLRRIIGTRPWNTKWNLGTCSRLSMD